MILNDDQIKDTILQLIDHYQQGHRDAFTFLYRELVNTDLLHTGISCLGSTSPDYLFKALFEFAI